MLLLTMNSSEKQSLISDHLIYSFLTFIQSVKEYFSISVDHFKECPHFNRCNFRQDCINFHIFVKRNHIHLVHFQSHRLGCLHRVVHVQKRMTSEWRSMVYPQLIFHMKPKRNRSHSIHLLQLAKKVWFHDHWKNGRNVSITAWLKQSTHLTHESFGSW